MIYCYYQIYYYYSKKRTGLVDLKETKIKYHIQSYIRIQFRNFHVFQSLLKLLKTT